MTDSLQWLVELARESADLPQEPPPRSYYAQPKPGQLLYDGSLSVIVRRVNALVRDFYDNNYFADHLGLLCNYPRQRRIRARSTSERELEQRVGKPHLWDAEPETWDEEDLYQFIEVFHDIAARPTKRRYHQNCGWHPTHFSPQTGRTLYRWRMNLLLDSTPLMLRIADSGNDIGRMVEAPSPQLRRLSTEVLNIESPDRSEIAHAIATFRDRHATVEAKRSAVRDLATVLESHRKTVMKEHLARKDESALFQIANEFNIRHKNTNQRTDYRPEFLEWVFYWYLATIQLCEQLKASTEISNVEPYPF